ncbi:unnamed protein product [Ambrosiozyma monospora]|uniref:Unnamed protein product n=1 Tax=Ambrosiozyma monospora TaxID=43982 RepID=A0ACB5SUR6_AMBMO|nr:unnamed protein product [Ambrosiozyma monospora]
MFGTYFLFDLDPIYDHEKPTLKSNIYCNDQCQDVARQEQTDLLAGNFKDAINMFKSIESLHSQDLLLKAVSQYKTINPEASHDEATKFVHNIGNQQIFDNAIAQFKRKNESFTVLKEIKSRQQEVQRTEKMATELSQLFEDLQALVFEQEPVNGGVEVDLAKAEVQLAHAVKHAKRGRLSFFRHPLRYTGLKK